MDKERISKEGHIVRFREAMNQEGGTPANPVRCLQATQSPLESNPEPGAAGQRAVWVASHLRESQVDAVRERRDDQPPVQTHVLVTVAEGARALPDVQLVRLPVPVEPQLTLPLKLPGLENAGRGGEKKGGRGGWRTARPCWVADTRCDTPGPPGVPTCFL